MRRLSLAAVGLASLVCLAACDGRSKIEITYDLTAVDISKLARLETIIHVDPKDGREFFVDQPYRAVEQGIGYEVRDLDGDGVRELILLHEASLGFQFASKFTFKLLPPATGKPPALILSAKAYGPSNALGEATEMSASYGQNGKVMLAIASTLCGGLSCSADQVCCDGTCVLVDGDPMHCGTCGNVCGASTDGCSGGVCRCNGGAACGPGQTCCAGEGCIDLSNDRFNCGACGKSCNPGETCGGGQCRCGDSDACSDGGLCCNVDGVAACSTTGSCACGGSVTCVSPEVCCDSTAGLCADIMNDASNCGGCGVVCAAGLECKNGSCRCNGQICAEGDACCADGCHTLADDPSNCGGCGVACKAGETCSESKCRCNGAGACSGDKECCSDGCQNVLSDARNCGGCGIACQPGEDCVGGSCSCSGGAACAPGNTCCPNAGCVNLQTNPSNCSECGNACGAGQACAGGVCSVTLCDPFCALNANECENGKCFCSTPMGMGPPCTLGQTCCPGQGCKDLLSDIDNCNACGNQCNHNFQQCCLGACRSSTLLCLIGESCNGTLCATGYHCCPGCSGGGPAMTNSGESTSAGTDANGTTYTCVPNDTKCDAIVCPD